MERISIGYLKSRNRSNDCESPAQIVPTGLPSMCRNWESISTLAWIWSSLIPAMANTAKVPAGFPVIFDAIWPISRGVGSAYTKGMSASRSLDLIDFGSITA